MRVLKWMIDRIEGRVKGVEHAFGISPSYSEINWDGLDFDVSKFEQVTNTDKSLLMDELKLHSELFDQLSYHLPKALTQTKEKMQERLHA
jgi:phosphoenolpyruvate carboxykinase (GTP)